MWMRLALIPFQVIIYLSPLIKLTCPLINSLVTITFYISVDPIECLWLVSPMKLVLMKSWRSNSLDLYVSTEFSLKYDACFAYIGTTVQCYLNMSFQKLPHSQLMNMEHFLYLQQMRQWLDGNGNNCLCGVVIAKAVTGSLPFWVYLTLLSF